MNLGTARTIGVSVALCVAFGSCRGSNPNESPREVVTVSRMDVQSEIVASGTVKPEVGAEVNVGPRISGVLTRLHVRVGDHVATHQLLAQLDHTDLDAAVDVATANVREAEAGVAQTEDVRKRREALARSGLVSSEDLELARSEATLAEARLERARATLRQVQIQRGYAEVFAPISGTVTAIATREGETVAASFAVPTFVTIMDLSRLQVEAYVDEVDIGRVAVGQQARFTVDAFPQETFEGLVRAVVPQPKVRETVVNYVVILTISTENRTLLRPGMTASVSITCGAQTGALVIPTRAIQRDAEGRPFVTVQENGRELRRDVALGELYGAMVRVKGGLAEGESVLVPGAAAEDQGGDQ